MSIISEKVAYLRGLAEGMKIDAGTNEGKLMTEIIDTLGIIAEDMEYLEDSQDELFERVYDVEDEVFGDDDEFGFDDDDEGYSIKCPNCKEEFYCDFDDLDDDGDVVCPNCDEEIEFDFGCGCDDCDEC